CALLWYSRGAMDYW
nr:immunoglobulin heavy chain junction region [Mus musculus]